MRAPTVSQFGGYCWVHVHTGQWHGGGEQISGGNGVQRGRDQEREPNSWKGGAHRVLCVEGVRDHSGQWTIVPDGACKYHPDAVTDAGGHDPALHQSTPYRFLDAADGPNFIDRAQVVFMPVPDGLSCLEPVAQAGPEQVGFEIVSGEGVSAEHDHE